MDTDRLAEELVDRWTAALARRDWPQRLELLTDIHEKLKEDVDSIETYAEVSPRFIGRLVDRLGYPEVTCEEQAHIYANSNRSDHREAAGRYFGAAQSDSMRQAG
jgi:hypothetical protein